MAKDTTRARATVGIDVGDKESSYAVVDEEGEVRERGKVGTTAPALEKLFRRLGKTTVVMEVGTHSPWVSRLLKGKGQRVIVANARQVPLITRSVRKNDRNDAETLARLGRVDAALLSPVEHRGQAALLPLLALIEEQSKAIGGYDREVERLGQEDYPETGVLRQVPGVGSLTALAYVLTLEEKGRFKESRQVGAYLGLVPRQQESGERRPELHITRAGDRYLRTLLVQCAHYIMGPFGPDTKLRRWGLKLAGEGSTARKKRALVAVARKLSVLLHRLWVSGERYEPFHGEEQPIAA